MCLLGELHGVGGPGEILRDVHPQEFSAADSLHSRAVDGQWGVVNGTTLIHLEIKVWSLEEEWRGTESKLLEVQCEVSEFSDDLWCRDVCWCCSIVFYQVHRWASYSENVIK